MSDPTDFVGQRATLILRRPGGNISMSLRVHRMEVQHPTVPLSCWSSPFPIFLGICGPSRVTIEAEQADPEPRRRRRPVRRPMPAALAMD